MFFRQPLAWNQRLGRGARVTAAAGALLGVLFLSLGARLFFVARNALSYDESHILTFGAFAARGLTPYREFFAGLPPAAVGTVAASTQLFGDSPWVRLPLVLLGVGAVGLLFALVAHHSPFHPLAAAGLAALFFSFDPAYFDVSNTLNLEAAAICCGLLAVWAMSRHADHPAPLWPVLSGAAFAFSLGYKILLPFLPGVILVQMGLALVAQGHTVSWGRALTTLVRWDLLWLVGFAGIILVASLWVNPVLVYQQVIDFRLDLRTATLAGTGDVDVAEDLRLEDWLPLLPLGVGALLSVPRLWQRRPAQLWLWGSWLILGLLMLTTHIPLRPRHLVIILPPLAALTGMAIAGEWDRLRTRPARLILALVAAMLVISSGWRAIQAAPIPDFTANQPARANVIDYIRATTAPTDCIVSKENRFYFLADRFPPPFLTEVSTSRLFSRKLTVPALTAELDRRDCAVLIYADSYDDLAPGLYGEAAQDYSLTLDIGTVAGDEPIRVFAVPLDTTKPPSLPLDVDLGGQILLRGVDLTPGPWTRGQTLYLSAYWRAEQLPSTDYRVFVHLIDSNGQLALAADHFPFEVSPDFTLVNYSLNPAYLDAQGKPLPTNYPNAGLIPTHLWRPGATLKETVPLLLDVPPGQYTLQMGLFDPVTGVRLDVDDAVPGGVENHIVLTTLEIQ